MYRIVVDDDVHAQLAALPDDLLVPFREVLDVLELTPWSGEPYSDRYPDGSMRLQHFGPSAQGMVIYLVLEDQQRVDLLRVVWLV